ncbi:MAG: LptA/OstA family protein [Treponema sp.]|nr:LptA/OstA family protein [Treponema sp.]
MKINEKLFLTVILFSLGLDAFGEKIKFSANSMSGTVGDKSDSTILQGEAYVLTETMEIAANKISMSGKNFRYIEAEGEVTGKNMKSELEFSCTKLHYDRETKIARLTDDVNLKDTKNDVTAKAQLIEYNQSTDIAIIQIDLELKQKNNVCTGAFAIYDKKQQTLDLSGNAKIKQGEDTFKAQVITLNLNTQEISLDGRVQGSIVDERKNEKKDEPSDTSSNDAAPSDTDSAPEDEKK